MGIVKFKQSVRDGYLEDLPEAIQSKVISICKLVTNKLNEKIKDEHYEDLTSSNWAMSCLDEFRTPPTMKGEVGSVRVYKCGKQYKCMIQVTGHFRNHQYGWIEELLHEIIADTYQEVRPDIRRKFDVTLNNESTRGNPNEGFDIFLNKQDSEKIWNLFEGRKTKAIKESSEEYLDEGFFDIFKKHKPTDPPTSDVAKRRYIIIGDDDKQSVISEFRNIELNINNLLKPIFDKYPIYGLKLIPADEKDILGNFIDINGSIGIELTNDRPDMEFIISIRGIDQYEFMDIIEKEHPDEVERLKQAGHDLERRDVWTEIHWTEKILGYDKSLDDICTYMENIMKENFPFISDFNYVGDNDSGPIYNGYVDPNYLLRNIDMTNIVTECTNISDDLIQYYENYYNKMSYDQYFDERSHGKLKYEYRIGYNIDDGGILTAVEFELDPNKITVVGMNTKEDNQPDMVQKLKSSINRTGHIDHATGELKVHAIFNKNHKSYNSCRIVPMFTQHMDSIIEIAQELFGNELNSSMTESRADEIFGKAACEFVKRNHMQPELYKVGELGGKNKYKTTKLFWNREQFYNFRFTPVIRGYLNKRVDNIKAEKSYTGMDSPGDINRLTKETIRENRQKHASDLKRKLDIAKDDLEDELSYQKNNNITDPESIRLHEKLVKRHKRNYDGFINGRGKSVSQHAESANNTPEYNVDMTETQAKRTLRTLSQDIINKTKENDNYKISQYTANIYANIITKNLLPKWASGYKKLSITLDSYQSFLTFEFKIPTMSQDFVSRFINGREPINAFLHRVPEIKIKMSPRIFHTMQDPDDAFNFFKAAIKYYDQKVENYSKRLMSEAMKLNHSMKHLVSTTNLSGIVTLPMQLLFVFDDVHMNNARTFLLSDEDLRAVNSFIKGIYTKYAAPEKEKKKIIEDVRTLVKDLRESCEIDDNLKSLIVFPESVEKWLTGQFDTEIQKSNDRFIREQVDLYEMNNPSSSELQYIREKFGVKKLKRIPNDLVAYISIETDAIETPNDKLMIASYCLSKIEIVEWYIELLEVGSKKYIVPHSLPFLQNVRTQLLQCYKNIMAVKVSSNRNRPIIDIQYPKGYEG